MDSFQKPSIVRLLKPINNEKVVTNITDSYLKHFKPNEEEDVGSGTRKGSDTVKEIVNNYYDMATDFFEYGWGESFHFATHAKGESREHSFAKHEYRLALKLGLTQGDNVLDIGCGIGGPARHIAAFTGAKVTGLNINDYQLQRARILTAKAGLSHICDFIKGDFCNAPFPSESFSKVYGIEATCHASDDLSRVYGEVYRLLKPGGVFANYEWVMTEKYDPTNAYHRKIKEDILIGDGLPDLVTPWEVREHLKKVGFEVLEAVDLVPTSVVPWYSVLQPKWTLSDFKITPLGRWATHAMLVAMETMRLAPKGSCKVHSTLCRGADGLVLGGKEGIFSPMYMFVVRKPDRAS